MEIYIVWKANAYGNKAIHKIYQNEETAKKVADRLKREQFRYDNDYYYTKHKVEE